MAFSFLAKLFPNNNSRVLKSLAPIVDRINALEPEMQALSEEALSAKTQEFKERLARGQSLDSIIPEAFAVVREMSRRTIGQRHYDVQLIGGLVLCQGKIAEMKTGEGKTLTSTLALYTKALEGKGAHLVTVNDYLARRDAEWMAPIFNKLGLSVGVLQHTTPDEERAALYQHDILYATNNELGFDYLRDNMKFRLADYVQRELHYAIVDEVDSILIDEARTPLIISGSSDESSALYERMNQVVSRLQAGVDYDVDEKQRNVQLTESGTDKLESALSIGNLYDLSNIKILHHANVALRAHALFKRDVDYVVRDNQVLIVDEFTGRIMQGRRYSDGLHQAIEAKEHVNIQRESQTVASITLQNYFRLYTQLAGMTGTAATEAEEFHKIYKLDVVSIPTHRPMIRDDKADLLFMSQQAKERAIVKDILERHKKQQPVLIGTTSVESSERLSMVLQAHGVVHDVLNAKNHAREADIVALAGQPGRVTIATNMAGRGTDIKLPSASLQAGGLYILGTERHESRRIDNQLRGRSGRQGDPGESRFYLSPDDNLIRIFGGGTFKQRIEALKKLPGMEIAEDDVIESAFFSRQIERMQERVERDHFEMRKHLLEYDDVLNQQRKVMYAFRRQVLEGMQQMEDVLPDMIADVVQWTIDQYVEDRALTHEGADAAIHALAALGKTSAALLTPATALSDPRQLAEHVTPILVDMYQTYQAQHAAAPHFAGAIQWLILNAIDTAWRQHMLNLDHLKEGIGLRGMGQKNPLTEYKREAYHLFQDMMRAVKFEVVQSAFRLTATPIDLSRMEQEREHAHEAQELHLHGPTETGESAEIEPVHETRKSSPTVGRNEECPCGSGKKYKKCCGK